MDPKILRWAVISVVAASTTFLYVKNEDPKKQTSRVPLIEANTPQPFAGDDVLKWWAAQKKTLQPYWDNPSLQKKLSDEQKTELEYLKGDGFLTHGLTSKPWEQN